jgi:predicted acyl esterase
MSTKVSHTKSSAVAQTVKTGRRYKFTIEKSWLLMPDGVRLAATSYIPKARRRGETFPVLLEYLPYRKDDTFYVVDHPFFSYQAQLGFITVKVDIRGTGASEGEIPEREYSDTEMRDCEEIIKQLAARPDANGNVGMLGVSWSGFNSLQMAMRRPPALKAIHAVHASDDLYQDDMHYIDGNLHIDPYHLFINHELGLPRTPDYKLDADYFAQRFNHRPWLFTYLNNQLDGDFWRKKSLREDPSQINIPVYLIGGLLDGYRTATARMFQQLDVPVRCDIGPWEHSCPDEGQPGPNYEWQKALSDWFNRYLRPETARRSSKNKKELMVFVRHGHKPDIDIETVPGYWRKDTLPAQGGKNLKLFLTASGKLRRSRVKTHVETTAQAETTATGQDKLNSRVTLAYQPFAGTAAGTWWGNKTSDMAADDAQSLVFDSEPAKEALQIIGNPRVKLSVSSTSPKAKWTFRLEDVAPDGSVALITGALANPAHRVSRLAPSLPGANEVYELELDLHFTTWTFSKGHKIRLAIANAQFPMAWPSADSMVSTVIADGSATLTLPTVPVDVHKVRELPKLARKQSSPDSWSIDFPASRPDGKPDTETFNRVNKRTGEQSHTIKARSAYVIDKSKGAAKKNTDRVKQGANRVKRTFLVETNNTWSTNPANPANSKYLGIAQTTMISQGKHLRLRTRILVQSDEHNFYISVTRTMFSQNGRVVRQRRFTETVARQFQ